MGILVGPQVFLAIHCTGNGEVFIRYTFILYLCELNIWSLELLICITYPKDPLHIGRNTCAKRLTYSLVDRLILYLLPLLATGKLEIFSSKLSRVGAWEGTMRFLHDDMRV